jgi:hypothetical protein
MAGDWIKMRAALTTCPKVAAMARAIGMGKEFRGLSRQSMRLLVVGGLHAVWAAVNEHTSDGVMSNSYPEDLDDIAGIEGFGQAMQAAGWLEVDEATASLTFPNFGQWNTPAKDTTAAERMRKHREKQRVTRNSVTVTEPLRVTVTTDKTRQDKRELQPASPVPTTEPATPSRLRAKSAVAWTADAGWTGITDADRAEWAAAFPGAELKQELAKATAWLKANPKRAGRRNWRRFLVGWLQRCQDKGGTHREAGNRPAGPTPEERAKRRFFRGDAQRSMTDQEYAEWRRGQRPSTEAAALAGAITLAKEGT